MQRVCKECGIEFSSRTSNTYGLCSKCYKHAWYLKTKDNKNKYYQDYRDSKKDKTKIYNAEYRKVNKEKIKLFHVLYRERHRDKLRLYHSTWIKENYLKYKAIQSNRRGRLVFIEGSLDFLDLINIYIEYPVCVYCGDSNVFNHQLDHIFPVSKGGSNWVNNIQTLCTNCNMNKRAKLPWVYEESIGFERDPEFWNNFRLYTTPDIIYHTGEEEIFTEWSRQE